MSKANSFERTMMDLETIVNALEKGDLSLEEALKQFEKGVSMARKCQETLKIAELKMQELQSQTGLIEESLNHENP